MAVVEFHQILLSSLGGGESPKLLPLPVLPGPSLALTSLRRHFPQAAAMHYWLDPSTLVTLPKVHKIEQSQCLGEVTSSSAGDFFILPFLDPTINFFVTEVEKENIGLNARVALLEDLVAEQRDFFTSITSLLSEAVVSPTQKFNVDADTAACHMEWEPFLDNPEVCADCGGEPKTKLNPESEAFFPLRNAISNGCDQFSKVSFLNPNCKEFNPTTTSYSPGDELQAVDIEEVSGNENNEVDMSGGLFKVLSLNPDSEPFNPSALSPEHSIGVTSRGVSNIKEKETDENNNKKECVESHAETSTLRKGDKDEETAVSKVKEVVVEDVVCKSIRPKIILKAHCHRRS